MKIVITESQLKILLSEVKKTCPDGWDYSGDAERCIKTRELPQLEVVAFQNDDNDKSISKSLNFSCLSIVDFASKLLYALLPIPFVCVCHAAALSMESLPGSLSNK